MFDDFEGGSGACGGEGGSELGDVGSTECKGSNSTELSLLASCTKVSEGKSWEEATSAADKFCDDTEVVCP